MRWAIKSIEWSAAVAKMSGDVLPYVTHAVLPDLPSTDAQVRSEFRSTVPRSNRIETAAINQMNRDSYLSKVLAIGSHSDSVLVVGGNKKYERNLLATPDAIEMMCRSAAPEYPSLWAVLDPNCPNSIEDAYRKYDAGASRFITQPILSSRGFEALQRYPQPTQDDALVYVAGVAFPKTIKGLLFWESLLSPYCDLENDYLFRDHCAYFSSADADPTAWVERQLAMLATRTDAVDGLHFMPLQNVNSAMKVISSLEE